MTEPIISKERIKADAHAAARKYTNVNDACPYPFGTEAGRLFKAEFNFARASFAAVEEARTQINTKAAA